MAETAYTSGSKEVAAAIFVPKGQEFKLISWLQSHIAGPNSSTPSVNLAGFAEAPTKTDRLNKVLDMHGLTRAQVFFYLQPFYDGRDAALLPAPHPSTEAGLKLWYAIAAIFAASSIYHQVSNFRRARRTMPRAAAAKSQGFNAQRLAAKLLHVLMSKWIIGLGLIFLLNKLNLLALVFPFAILGFAYYGFASLSRKASVAAIGGLDRLTGVATSRHDLPPTAATIPAPAQSSTPSLRLAQAQSLIQPQSFTPKTQFNPRETTANDSPIIDAPSLGETLGNLLKTSGFGKVFAVLGLVAALLLPAYWLAGTSGVEQQVQTLTEAFTAPITNGSVNLMQDPPATMTPAASDTTIEKAPARLIGLPNFSLLIAGALIAAYARRWFNRRFGLRLHDPWEKLDQRLT